MIGTCKRKKKLQRCCLPLAKIHTTEKSP